MKQETRIVYVNRTGRYERIAFSDIYVNEPFILCEEDGTPVGHYLAASSVFKINGVSALSVLEIS